MVMVSSCAQEVPLPDNADPELRSGSEVFRQKCASCHGVDGGGALGPSLQAIDERLELEEQRAVLLAGRKAMPSFANTLSDTDIDAVLRYTREIL